MNVGVRYLLVWVKEWIVSKECFLLESLLDDVCNLIIFYDVLCIYVDIFYIWDTDMLMFICGAVIEYVVVIVKIYKM